MACRQVKTSKEKSIIKIFADVKKTLKTAVKSNKDHGKI